MTQQTSPDEVARIFDAEVRDAGDAPFEPSWNVAPTDPVTVVLQRDDGRAVERHRWGLVPPWAKAVKEGARNINARAEGIAESPTFRTSFRKRRCIIPADGFYEWQRTGGKRRQPWYLAPDTDDAVLALAGLWSVWKDPVSGVWVPSTTVITTDANDDLATLHDRMPVLLPQDAWAAWLDPEVQDQGLLLSFLRPAPDGVLEMHAVSTRVNDVRNDGPELIEALAEGDADDAGAGDRPAAEEPARSTGAGTGRRRAAQADTEGQGTLFD